MHDRRAGLSLLLAALFVSLPADLRLLKIETFNRLQEVPMLARALPPTPTLIAGSRAHQSWVSTTTKQNTHHAVATGCTLPEIQFSRYGKELEVTLGAQPHKVLHNCDRAPPPSDSREDH
jgi:hypothetical protein